MERLPESIELMNSGLEVSVNTKGAWIEAMKFRGHDVLYPRSGNNEGGMYVCLPQFGSVTSFSLPEHGFAREEQWEVLRRYDSDVILELIKNEKSGNYPAGLEAMVRYKLVNDETGIGLTVKLAVSNLGGEPLPIAPAFHPYFATNGEVNIEGFDHPELLRDLSLFSETYIQNMPAKFVAKTSSDRPELTLSSELLRTYTFWTDNPSEYLCVEPTLLGANFDKKSGRLYLEPNQNELFEFEILISKY